MTTRPADVGAATRGGIGLPALLLAVVASGGAAQESLPGTGAELVRLDVVVSDQQRRPIRNLRREDFEVLEDGKPQGLVRFLAVDVGAAVEPPGAAGQAEGEAPSTGPGRQIVIVVDDLHIAPGNLEYTKQALRRLVKEFVAPDDNVGLVTTRAAGGTQQLTRDRAPLTQAIDRLVVKDVLDAPRSGSQMTPAQAELILRGDRTALVLAARTMLSEPGSVLDNAGPRNALAGAGGVTPAGIDVRERVAAEEAQREARAVLAESLRFSVATLATAESVMRGLSDLPGRKVCVLVSDGFLLGLGTSEERRRDLQYVIDAATRSGTVVYALDARGLISNMSDAGVAGRAVGAELQGSVAQQSQQLVRTTLENVARATGGFLVQGTNDLAGGLERMLADNQAYYLMAYEPRNTKRDGRFRKIEVRVSGRSGLSVRTRTGYLAPDDRKRGLEPQRPSRADLVTPPPLAPAFDADAAGAVLGAPPAPDPLPVRLSADYVQLPPAGPQALVRVHVDLASLGLVPVAGRVHDVIELAGEVYDVLDSPLGSPFSRRYALDVAAAQLAATLATGLLHEERLALAPGRYRIRVAAREAALGRTGAADQWIDIPDLRESKLAMSGVFLDASERYKAGGRLTFQLYVYNPLLDADGRSDVVLQAQIWSEGKALAASRPKPVAFTRKDGALVPETHEANLEGMASGVYELRVVVVDHKANATVFRSLAFRLE